jgi:hypothetical protein
VSANLGAILSQVLAELDRWAPAFREALLAHEPAAVVDAVLAAQRAHASEIAAAVPDPGWAAPQMRAFTIGGLLYVALHRALAPRGYDAARTWAICDAATRTRFANMSALERRLASDGMFSWPMKALSRWLAGRSTNEPVGGWVFDFVEGKAGEFDYGVDYKRCAIRELAIANGAADLAPYICLADVPGSDIFGWGLVRTETLAQGGARCDFRFRRGSPTDVLVRLPVIR